MRRQHSMCSTHSDIYTHMWITCQTLSHYVFTGLYMIFTVILIRLILELSTVQKPQKTTDVFTSLNLQAFNNFLMSIKLNDFFYQSHWSFTQQNNTWKDFKIWIILFFTVLDMIFQKVFVCPGINNRELKRIWIIMFSTVSKQFPESVCMSRREQFRGKKIKTVYVIASYLWIKH